MAVVKMKVERRLAALDDSVKRTIPLYKKILSEEWRSVAIEHLHNLYNSMPQRCRDVVAKGGDALKC